MFGSDAAFLSNYLIIKLKIGKLKEDKAPGYDGITPKSFKEVVNETAEPLTKIKNFNRSVSIPVDYNMVYS